MPLSKKLRDIIRKNGSGADAYTAKGKLRSLGGYNRTIKAIKKNKYHRDYDCPEEFDNGKGEWTDPDEWGFRRR